MPPSTPHVRLNWKRSKARRQPNEEEVLIIPIVFHVIHFNGPENISTAQVQDAVDVLEHQLSRTQRQHR